MKKIPFGKPLIGENEKKEIGKVLDSHILTHGPKCKEFEDEFKRFVGTKHAITTSNCTTAIHLCLEVLGIKNNDEVIVPAMTHVATAHAVEHTGAKPVFVDVNEKTGCISIDKIEKAITSKTKAIIVVHFVGLPCEMDKIIKIAKKNNLKIIEDSATALGAKFKEQRTGSIGDFGCFSFYPTKHITSMEGGMIVTNSDEYASKIKKIKAFGYNKNLNERSLPGLYDVDELGWNYRMSEGNAAIGLEQLKKIHHFLKSRKENAKIIFNILQCANDKISLIPLEYYDCKSSWYCINLMMKDNLINLRNDLIKKINDLGIQTSIHYPVALPFSMYYKKKYGYNKNQFPNSYKIGQSTISLPCAPHLTRDDAKYTGNQVIKVLKNLN